MAWFRGCEHLPEAAVIALAFFEWNGIAQENLENTLITVRKYLILSFCLAIPCISARMAAMQLSIDFRYIHMVFDKPTTHQFVQRIDLLALWAFLDCIFCRHTWDIMLPSAPAVAAQLHIGNQVGRVVIDTT